jgi:hypothetical protein
MNSLFIGSTIDSETQTMTVHYDGSVIELKPYFDDRNFILVDVIANGKILLTADHTSSNKITIPGTTKEHVLHLKNKLKYDKYEPTKCKWDSDDIVCSIDKIPLHHTKKDPMIILKNGYAGIVIFIFILAYHIVAVSTESHVNIIDVIGFGMLMAICVTSFFLYRRHHVLALALALAVMVIDSSNHAWAILQAVNADASDTFVRGMASIFLGRVICILLTVRGLVAGMKVSDLNREIHNKLVTTT